MLEAAIMTGVASLIGGRERNSAQSQQARNANSFSAREASINRNFQKNMSDTMVQRRMKDLKMAGINPILAANSAASSPSGSAPTGQQAQITDAITPAVSTAVTANQSISQAELIQEQLKPVMDQIGSVQAETYLKMAQKALARLDANQREAAIELLTQQIIIAEKEAIISGIKADLLLEGLDQLKANTPLDTILR